MRPSKALTVGAHITGWLLFFGLAVAFVYTSSRGDRDVLSELFSPPYLLFYFTFLVLFYLNGEVLIPKLYLQKNYVLYFTVILLLFIIVFFLKPFDGLLRPDPERFRPMPRHGPPLFREGPPPDFPARIPPPRKGGGPKIDIISLVLFVGVWAVSTALQIIKQWRNTERRAALAEAEKARAELSFLKTQIHPHFLFNTLNNIYTLAVTKSEATPQALLQLSQILRYVTDEVRQDFVLLQREVDCMSNYIALQRLRLNEKTTIDYSVNGQLEDKQIAPLLLMTFAENVFKYGVSSREPSPITIQLMAEEKTMVFYCRNKIFQTRTAEERTGIGIRNTKERLDLLYPDKHILRICTDDGFYTVQLTLQV